MKCILSDIPAQITDEIWSLPTEGTDGYTLNEGTFDPTEKSQVSTLTISAAKLVKLRNSAKSHVFSCEIAVGSHNRIVADFQNITLFNPSENNFYFIFVSHS